MVFSSFWKAQQDGRAFQTNKHACNTCLAGPSCGSTPPNSTFCLSNAAQFEPDCHTVCRQKPRSSRDAHRKPAVEHSPPALHKHCEPAARSRVVGDAYHIQRASQTRGFATGLRGNFFIQCFM